MAHISMGHFHPFSMEHGPFIDGLPIKNGDFPLNMVLYLFQNW